MLSEGPRWTGTAAAVGFGLVLAVGLVVEVAAMLSRQRAWSEAASTGPIEAWGRGALFLVITAAVCVAALTRRRLPGPSAAVAIGLCAVAELIDWLTVRAGQPAPVACLALLVVVASAVRFLPAAGAIAVAAGGGVVAVGTVERYATYLEQDIPNARSATLVMATGWAIATGIGVWRRLADARQHTMIETARRNERLALARDLHDVAAHHLTGLIIQTQVAQLGKEQAALAEIEAGGARALDALRQVVRLLREDQPPRPGSVRELVDGAGARLEGSLPEDLPLEVESAVYRIVQEALTNVARHAKNARTVVVTLSHDERCVRVRVTDDGVPRRRTGTGGHGLAGMRERVEALGGEFGAGPGGPHGWTVTAVLPVRGAA